MTLLDPSSPDAAGKGLETRKAPSFTQRVSAALDTMLKRASDLVSGIPQDSSFFSPGQPLRPSGPPSEIGRAFDYQQGINQTIRPRGYENISFWELRALAEYHDLTRLMIETRKDQVAALKWTIRPSVKPKTAAQKNDMLYRSGATQAFMMYPDGVTTFVQWTRQLLEDILVIDAPSIWVDASDADNTNFRIIDGATIKVIVDEDGRPPPPPSPAYQQIIKGLPAWNYTTSDLIYMPRNPRPGRLYGFPPVQQIITTVNIALRRQSSQLQYFTDGNIPDALISTPENWTPEQVIAYQKAWDALFEGQTANRRRAKFVPGQVTMTQTKEAVLLNEFDEWLMKIVAFAFSIPPSAFINNSGNRATAQTMKEAALEEGLTPLLIHLASIFNVIIQRCLGQHDLEFAWNDKDDASPAERATLNDIKFRNGTKTINRIREEEGDEPVEGGDVPIIMTASGPIPVASLAYLPVEPPPPPTMGGTPPDDDGKDQPPAKGKDAKQPQGKVPKDDQTGDGIKDRGEQSIRDDQTMPGAKAKKALGGFKADRPFVEAGKSPLYVRRNVLNAGAIIEWFKEQGFETCLSPEDLHVTQIYSKAPVNWDVFNAHVDTLNVQRGRRAMKQFGEASVMVFESARMQARHRQFLDGGCSFDFDRYAPHITINYADHGLALDEIEPFPGIIELGPEIFEAIDDDWKDSLVEKAWDESKHPRDPAGTSTGGQWTSAGPSLGEPLVEISAPLSKDEAGGDGDEAEKAYDPDQLRAPKGTREGGRWIPQGAMLVPDEDRPHELYHGTAAAYLDDIRDNGIVVAADRRNFPEHFYTGERGEVVFATDSMRVAQQYADTAIAGGQSKDFVVLRIKPPADAMLAYDDKSFDSFMIGTRIPPEWITGYKLGSDGRWSSWRTFAKAAMTFYIVVLCDEAGEGVEKAYNPDQPRAPVGSPIGGRWIAGPGPIVLSNALTDPAVRAAIDSTLGPGSAQVLDELSDSIIAELPPGEYNIAAKKIVGFETGAILNISGHASDPDGRYTDEETFLSVHRSFTLHPKTKELEVFHGGFIIPRFLQGKGIGSGILSASLPFYDRLGASQIYLTANMEVGGYAWAKAGFSFDGSDFSNATKFVEKHLVPTIRSFALDDGEAFRLSSQAYRFAEHPETMMYNIAGMRRDSGSPVGKRILLGTSWNGYLNLKDPTQRQRYEAFISRGRAARKNAADSPATHICYEYYKIKPEGLLIDGAREFLDDDLDDVDKAYNPDQPRAPRGTNIGGRWVPVSGLPKGVVVIYNTLSNPPVRTSVESFFGKGADLVMDEMVEDILAELPPGKYSITVDEALDAVDRRQLGIKFNIYGRVDGLDDSESDTLEMHRLFVLDSNTHELTVLHEGLVVPYKLQGKGLGSRILSASLTAYDQLGVQHIKLTANMEVGGYAWASAGFGFDGDDDDHARFYAEAELIPNVVHAAEREGLPHDEIERLKDQVYDFADEPRDMMYNVAKLTGSNGRKLGKRALLRTEWDGSLDLGDAVQRQRYEEFLRKDRHMGTRGLKAAIPSARICYEYYKVKPKGPLIDGAWELLGETPDSIDKVYDPSQPRDPRGVPTGGRWSAGGLRVIGGKPQGGIAATYNKAKKRWEADGIEQKRLDAMAIPPAWTDVMIAEDPSADLQVIGLDQKGRSQYRYSELFAQSKAAAKFERVALLRKSAGKLDAATLKGLKNGDDDAAAVRLMLESGMRPGSDADTGAEKQAYGATTLLKEHVTVSGDTIHYEFTGKKGVTIKGSLTSPPLAGYVLQRLATDDGPRLFMTTAGKANAYIKGVVGADFKAKDLRTLKANAMAAEIIAGMSRPASRREYAAARNAVGDRVSAQLGNTRSVALKDYINPIVFKRWEPPGPAASR